VSLISVNERNLADVSSMSVLVGSLRRRNMPVGMGSEEEHKC